MAPFDEHPEVTPADVKRAAGAPPDAPENDVQAVLHALDEGLDERFALLELLDIALVQRGLNEGTAADWARAGARLGPGLVAGLITLARKLGG